jgi:Family of unknown function (DUF5309)
MAGIVGMANTFNTPNYVGELFAITPTDTPFLSAIGGLSGGAETASTVVQWQAYDLRSPDKNRQRLEGAAPPEAENRVRWNVRNVVEVHQESLDISYTRQAATGMYASTGSANPNAAGLAGTNPVADELAWQTDAQLTQIARDIEVSFISGSFQEPADNTQPRRTRGILEAITTNVITNARPAPLTDVMVLDLLQKTWENGGIQVSQTATLMCNAWQKRMLTTLFITDRRYQETSRTVGGVTVQTIETDFGTLNIMLNRHMPADTVAVVSLEQCAPVFLLVPGKGFLFLEPMAKTGANDRWQIYGEVGLKYGNERAHGKITGLATGPA